MFSEVRQVELFAALTAFSKRRSSVETVANPLSIGVLASVMKLKYGRIASFWRYSIVGSMHSLRTVLSLVIRPLLMVSFSW